MILGKLGIQRRNFVVCKLVLYNSSFQLNLFRNFEEDVSQTDILVDTHNLHRSRVSCAHNSSMASP